MKIRSKPGHPEPRQLSPLNSSPSELIGQTWTNMFQPAQQQLTQALRQQRPIKITESQQQSATLQQFRPLALPTEVSQNPSQSLPFTSSIGSGGSETGAKAGSSRFISDLGMSK